MLVKYPLPFQKVVFVCTAERCAENEGPAIREKLKAMVKARGLATKIRVSKSGCMDCCGMGPNIMVMPDNAWYGRFSEDDIEPFFESLVAAVEGG